MKRTLILLLALVLCFAFIACNVTPKDSDSDTETELDTSKKTDISTDSSTDKGTDSSDLDNQINIATTINNSYYKQISMIGREYIGNDFPEEYGEYYKVVKTYSELKALLSNVDSIASSIFNDNYVLIMRRKYKDGPAAVNIGFRDAKLRDEVAYIINDCHNNPGPVQDVEIRVDFYSCVIIPQSCAKSNDDGTVKEIKIIYDYRDYYRFEYESISDKKANHKDEGKAWLLKNEEEVQALNKQYGIDNPYLSFNSLPYDMENNYYLAIYSQYRCYNYMGFKDFYTDGVNVFITFEKLGEAAITPDPENPVMYFVEIPKEIVENEITGEVTPYYLIEKTQIPLEIPMIP